MLRSETPAPTERVDVEAIDGLTDKVAALSERAAICTHAELATRANAKQRAFWDNELLIFDNLFPSKQSRPAESKE